MKVKTLTEKQVGMTVHGKVVAVGRKVEEDFDGDPTQDPRVIIGYRIAWKVDGQQVNEVYYTPGPETALCRTWGVNEPIEIQGKTAEGKVAKAKRTGYTRTATLGRKTYRTEVPPEKDHLIQLVKINE